MATVKAVRFYGQRNLKIEEIAPQTCGPFDVRVKVAFCGICGSDIHEYLGGPILTPKLGSKDPHTGLQLPVTLGHEISGEVVEVGPAVTTVAVGQRCAINPSVDDRHHGTDPCRTCRLGKPNLCKRWACYGLSAPGGGFSDEIVVHSASIVPIPDSVPLRVAALCEPLAVACHMIRVSGFQPGDSILVLGAGPIGLALLLLLKVRGAGQVFVSEISPSRAEKARQFGADAVIDPTNDSMGEGGDVVVSFVQRKTEDGVDVSFDATGIQATLDTAIAATRAGGTIFNVAIHEKPLLINPNALTLTEKKYMGGLCYTSEDFAVVVEALASGKLRAEEMITAVVPLRNAIEGAFEELINNKDNHIKIIVHPN
ncbi:GroES-like protein [Lentithecium fluviatile CBS 122367]|uniref:GroES-like protein n=1 Tax=Lentithecium fluviatile CBS 122367 TaxID=1168545 RepID=A0A6G1JB43_9PLEO|nr:GroES-like protein [Lentithecium fluviatile CBS 122367]